MKSAKSRTPTPAKPSENSLQMASSSESPLPCTLDLAPVNSPLHEELVDTVVLVRERVQRMLVCSGMVCHNWGFQVRCSDIFTVKSSGCAVSESSAVY